MRGSRKRHWADEPNLHVFAMCTRRRPMQKIVRIGNSCAVRLPVSLLEAAGLKEGAAVALRLLDSGDIRLRPQRGRLTAGEYVEPPPPSPLPRAKW
ncbi:AbrB/MazE/SpoVT family DNA-binding domain-containing protein [Caenimonas sedimenti]|uniref:AbrB/MazE/SpoVT family DNA-binding domain-containing protein n=1 Tax=Caenimonas sedimenti TaxID=2596921 RepID=A0A562ZLT0_9BURK|nr:AbrB/MazE/SpoVT family DNA-binding domain-containing protein [Caenimonas sedimenti]